jgi:hypothetical protein
MTPLTMLTDAELVKAVQDGDRDAFADLVARYERAVWTRAWLQVKSMAASSASSGRQREGARGERLPGEPLAKLIVVDGNGPRGDHL